MWFFPVFNCVLFNFYLLRISGVSNKFSRKDHKIRRLFVGKTKLVDVCKFTYVQLLLASFINGNNTTVNFHAINDHYSGTKESSKSWNDIQFQTLIPTQFSEFSLHLSPSFQVLTEGFA